MPKSSSKPRTVVLALILVVGITIILAASLRSSGRLSSLFSTHSPLRFLQQHPLSSRPLTTSSMASSKYRKPPQQPPLFIDSPQSILEKTKKLIAESKQVEDDIVAKIKASSASFGSVLLPQALEGNRQADNTHILGFYQSVSSSSEIRDASTAAEQLMNDASIESAMRQDVFDLVEAAYKDKPALEKLDPESKRLLEKSYKGYLHNGLGIKNPEKRARFKGIEKRLSDLSTTFSKNLNEENGGNWFTKEELDGVPEDVLATLKKGEGEHEEKLWLTFKYPDYFPTMKYGTNSTLRRKLVIDNENKVNKNVALFQEAVVLRDEGARLLGYPNHAAVAIEDKMMKTPEAVNDFLADLKKRLSPGGLTELKKLQKLKAQDQEKKGIKDDDRYWLWDHRFYDTMMLQNEYSLDQQKIAEYFPLQTTIRGMLQIFEELFGLVFVEIQGEDRAALSTTGKEKDITWHPDVEMFSVWDNEGQGSGFVGYLYLDLFPREGKYSHAANFNIQPGYLFDPLPLSNSSTKDNSTHKPERHYPCTALVCNFSKPTPKKPSLLKHEEVVTLFHELGHGIHDLVSKTQYSAFHGTSVVRDFVEAPSQMLENWCWTPLGLKRLSHHWSHLSEEYSTSFSADHGDRPAEKMPDSLIENIIRTKHVNDALANLRQLHFGIFDMTIHAPSSHEAIEDLPISQTYNRLRREITKMDDPFEQGLGDDWGHGEATFGHLMGGYDAGYYGYMSSLVFACDMWASKFQKDPMDGEVGRRYRHTVLEKGGSREEMSLLEDFLGRKPNNQAFLKELGIAD